ncbi:hypothetical protein E6W39_20930 [Kitasatospora acidiphila]|uniref:Uncharacterized protein n=1 Tax=Kitasatospora acidiphila TaxID=2567942 RepID=A0A540W5D5_9ACTN|nr:hypothetical protein [Kitasatospora acidiphila]TQF04241.1 hypothetical protein E6W39_20930 [Kitasatospora acidiphila]
MFALQSVEPQKKVRCYQRVGSLAFELADGPNTAIVRIEAGCSLSPLMIKHALVVLKVLPVLLVVVLSAPAWLTWPFLPEQRQRMVLDMVKALADWTRNTA